MALSILSPDSLDLTQDFAGIHFGGTGSANQLDDYEEGTFTATIRGSSGEPATLITGDGFYTKVGNQVTVKLDFTNKNMAGYGGYITITGLPFANGVSGNFGSAIGMVYNMFANNASRVWTAFFIGGSGTTMSLYDQDPFGAWTGTSHSAQTSSYLWTGFTYTTS